MIPQLDDFRELIEGALEYGNGTHGFDDIVRMVDGGEAHFWPGVHSAIVTEFVVQPQRKSLNFFLAGGGLDELERMTPLILEWGKRNGCTHATFAGRRGWARTRLLKDWQKLDVIIMERAL